MAYKCMKCNYNVKKDEIPKRCPYCATEGSVQKVPSAQDWLDNL